MLLSLSTIFFTDTVAPNGELMYNDKNGGEINLSPVLSPDGKQVIFLSNRDVVKLLFYLALFGFGLKS